MLHADNGPVGRDMRRRGARVLARAKELVGIATGRLYNSLKLSLVTIRGRSAVVVSTDVPYARYHHDGTGIYGSRGTPIRPRNAKALRFKPRGSSKFVFAASVRGSRPNPFLLEALSAAADVSLVARARSLVNRLAGRNGIAAGVVAGRDAAKIPGSGPRPQRAPSTRRRRQQPARRSGWQSQVSGGRSSSGSRSGGWQGGVSAGRNATQPSTGGWQRNVTGGRSRTRDTGWARDVSGGRRASGQ